uniref:serine hydrolase domain-containing protein n=1 Tax=Psychroserpens jangbogonensis TaxID=1484460 RepID=UPI00053EB3F1
VGEFLPDREDLPESWKELSLKYLLSHTSGIPDIIDYGIFLAPESDDFVIKNMKDKPFTSALGTESRYNATAYMLVRIIIEKLAEQDFEEHMQKNYFDKFNLSTANYGGFKKVVPNRVTSYQMVGDKLEMFPLNYSPTMYAGAGLNIKIDELILWMQALLNEQILDKDQLNTIWTPYKLNNNEVGSFGLGWEAYEFENKIKINGHGGAGISSLLHYRKDGFPNTVTVILLTNGAKNWVQSPHSVNMGIANYFMPGVNDLD